MIKRFIFGDRYERHNETVSTLLFEVEIDGISGFLTIEMEVPTEWDEFECDGYTSSQELADAVANEGTNTFAYAFWEQAPEKNVRDEEVTRLLQSCDCTVNE